MIYTEDLAPDIARVMLGEKYKPECTYKLSQDRFEAAVWEYQPGVTEPEVIPLESDEDDGYDAFRPGISPYVKKTGDPVNYTEEIILSDINFTNLKRGSIVVCGLIIVACCIFVMGVYYGIFTL